MKLELGKKQTEWVKFLENNPELQWKGYLGIVKRDENGNLDKKHSLMCCLGAGLFILDSKLPEGEIADYFDCSLFTSGGSNTHLYLRFSYPLLGLVNGYGSLKHPYVKGKNTYNSLAAMNDGLDGPKLTWPEIAQYIRSNPENVFTESK